MGLVEGLVKFICFVLFCIFSGFTLTLGAKQSNIRIYYAFFAICIVGVMLVL